MAKTNMKITASKVQQNNVVAGIVAFLMALVIVSPLLYCLSASFLTEKEIFAKQILPTSLNGANYVAAL